MKTRMKRIALEGNGMFLGREKGCLVVRDSERKAIHYPLSNNEISEVELRSGNVVSTGALATCGFWNIDVIVETSRGHPVAILKSLYSDSHVRTRIGQYECTRNGKGIQIAKTFLISKLQGQDKLLSKYGLRRIDFCRIIERIKEADSTNKLTSIEGHYAEKYFEQVFGLFDESIRPQRRRGFKAYDGLNNLYNLSYTFLKWKVHVALLKAKLEPYLGFLHEITYGRPSLVCDFLELYRYLADDKVISYARNLKPSDFILKKEDFSGVRKGKREYLNDKLQEEYRKRLNAFFTSKVEIARIRRGQSQELETLINEEALLFASYLRGEKREWIPRLPLLEEKPHNITDSHFSSKLTLMRGERNGKRR